MRKAGFPCRVIGCDRAFQVLDQRSLDALKAASAACAEHEVSVHGYHHVRLGDEPTYNSYQRAKAKPAASQK
jgi:hypothetical protein